MGTQMGNTISVAVRSKMEEDQLEVKIVQRNPLLWNLRIPVIGFLRNVQVMLLAFESLETDEMWEDVVYYQHNNGGCTVSESRSAGMTTHRNFEF